MSPLRSVLVIAATAAVALAPLTAYAGTLSTVDASGDVVGSGSPAVVPTQANGDITRTVVKHTRRGLQVTVVARDLSPTGELETLVAVQTNHGYRRLELLATPGHYAGKLVVRTGSGQKVSCGRASAKISYTANTEVIKVPSRCLGKPRWVRVGIGMVTSPDNFHSGFADDARTHGTVSGEDPVLSPRIYR